MSTKKADWNAHKLFGGKLANKIVQGRPSLEQQVIDASYWAWINNSNPALDGMMFVRWLSAARRKVLAIAPGDLI